MQKALNSKKFNIEEETKHSNILIEGIKNLYFKTYKRFANSSFLGCVKKTIVLLLPIILIGFIASLFLYFPVNDYQNLIKESGFDKIFLGVKTMTIDIITLYFTVILTYRYMKDKVTDFPLMITMIATAFLCVFILSSDLDEGETFTLGFESIFLGIIYSYFTVKVFTYFKAKKHLKFKVYTTEAKKTFLTIVNLLIPFTIVFFTAIFIVLILLGLGGNPLIQTLGYPFKAFVEENNIEILNGIYYALISSVGSFFGIGFDSVLESSSMSGIVNPTFMRLFVFTPLLFGFIIALLVFGKRTDKIYGSVGTLPVSFSQGSIVHYSYPLFLNPISIIPLLFAPIITTIVSYYLLLAFNINTVNEVNNLSLVFLNSYDATNNGLAILIQGISIVICFAIFIPFILLNNYAKNRAFKENIKDLYPKYLEAKAKRKSATIFDFDFELGEVAKKLTTQLVLDLELMNEVRQKVIDFNNRKDSYAKIKDFENDKRELLDKLKKQLKIKSYFQPIVSNKVEFDESGKPIDFEIKGMECLMRWWYEGNYIIPPLALELARGANLEYEINSYLWENMLINVDRKRCKSFITFNISMNCLENQNFVNDLMNLFDRYDMDPSGFVVEITEEDEFTNEDEALKKIVELKEKGFDFAIDDYGAGQTSMKYFQTNAFELVKIDGDLVKKAKENEQVYDIIGNIKELGKRSQKYANIQFKVLCEFIEDKDSFERLAKLKVDYYQGYLFGKADEFDKWASDQMMTKGSQKHV